MTDVHTMVETSRNSIEISDLKNLAICGYYYLRSDWKFHLFFSHTPKHASDLHSILLRFVLTKTIMYHESFVDVIFQKLRGIPNFSLPLIFVGD